MGVTQLLDILIHAVTHQIEPLRVTSNIIILIWLAVMAAGKFKAHFRPTAVIAVGAYFTLNVIFLAREGVTNAAQGGGLRIALFMLMFITLTLSSGLIYWHGTPE